MRGHYRGQASRRPFWLVIQGTCISWLIASTKSCGSFARTRARDASSIFFLAGLGRPSWAMAGCPGPSRVHAADEHYYSRALMFYTDSHNLSGLFPWEAAAVDRHFHGCRSVLVSSAGGGREVVALERRGLEVFGFECHRELINAANDLLSRHGLKARVWLAPRDEFPAHMPTCDGAVVGWASYMLIQQRARRIEFLRQLRTHILAGGPLLISFFARSRDSRSLRITARIASMLRAVRGRPRAEVGDDLAPNFVHRFSEAEIARARRRGIPNGRVLDSGISARHRSRD